MTPLRTKEDKKQFWVGTIAIIIILAAVITAFAFSGDDSSKPPGKLEAYSVSQQFVKQQLKSPSTAKFPVYMDTAVITNDNKRFKVESYVEAENSFGVSVKHRYFCVLNHLEKDQWELVSLQLLD